MSSPRLSILPVLLAGVIVGSACSKAPAATGAATSAPAASSAMPAAMPTHEPASPAAQGGAAAATGKVVEKIDAGGYSYVRLDTGAEEIWAATNPITVEVGETLTVSLDMPMQNFHSAKLDRDFPLITSRPGCRAAASPSIRRRGRRRPAGA